MTIGDVDPLEKGYVTNNRRTLIKIIAIMCLSCVALSSIIAVQSPSNGYELSIYESTPLIVWVLLILSLFGGLLVTYFGCINSRMDLGAVILGIFILILSRFTLLSLPFIRGYFCWAGDTITHSAMIIDIILYGYWWRNPYPLSHIFSAEIISMFGVLPFPTLNYIPIIFSLLYVSIIFLLSRVAFRDIKLQLICTTSAIAVLLAGKVNTLYYAFAAGHLYILLSLYLLFKCVGSANKYYLILFIGISSICALLHPYCSLLFCIILISLGFYHYVLVNNTHLTLFSLKSNTNFGKIILYGLVSQSIILLFWIFYGISGKFDNNIKHAYSVMTTISLDAAETLRISDAASKLDLNFFDIIFLIFKTIGADLIFLSFAAISMIIFYRNRKELVYNRYVHYILYITIIFVLLLVISYIGILPGASSLNFHRTQYLFVLFTPIFLAFVYGWAEGRCNSHVFHIVFISIVLISIIVSIVGVFQSPLIMRGNTQVSYYDILQYDWFLENKDRAVDEMIIASPSWRIGGATFGFMDIKTRTDIKQGFSIEPFDDHFNYNNYDYIGENFLEDQYAIFPKKDKVIYAELWQTLSRFVESDFRRLNYDNTIIKIYDNQEGDIWYIKATAKNL